MRTALGIAFVLVVAWSAGWLMPPRHEGVTLSAQAQAFPWSRAPGLPQPPALGQAPAEAASAAAAPGERQARAGPASFELCGLGRIAVAAPVAPEGERPGVGAAGQLPRREPVDHTALAELPAPIGRFSLQDAQARLVQTLSAGDARQRVAARLLQDPSDADPHSPTAQAAQVAWARELLADALASRDAQALRWAGAACAHVDDEPGCRHRLARARVQAEPANALHWIEWAHEEPTAADAAWAGLTTHAQYWREQPLGLAGVLLRAVPTDIAGYLQATLAVDAMARDVSFPGPPLTLALERCAAARPGSGGAATPGAGACERVARLLVERGDSVQALMLGRELGEHIGWPALQLQRLEQEVALLQKQEHSWRVDERRPLGCETVEGQRGHIAAVEREGELVVLRRNLAAAAAAQPPR